MLLYLISSPFGSFRNTFLAIFYIFFSVFFSICCYSFSFSNDIIHPELSVHPELCSSLYPHFGINLCSSKQTVPATAGDYSASFFTKNYTCTLTPFHIALQLKINSLEAIGIQALQPGITNLTRSFRITASWPWWICILFARLQSIITDCCFMGKCC